MLCKYKREIVLFIILLYIIFSILFTLIILLYNKNYILSVIYTDFKETWHSLCLLLLFALLSHHQKQCPLHKELLFYLYNSLFWNSVPVHLSLLPLLKYSSSSVVFLLRWGKAAELHTAKMKVAFRLEETVWSIFLREGRDANAPTVTLCTLRRKGSTKKPLFVPAYRIISSSLVVGNKCS